MPIQIHPYADELVISMIARYHMYSGRESIKESLRHVYGMDSARPSIHLPSHLHRLSESGCFGITSETLVYEHTLFPYYAPFLRPEMVSRVLNDMLSDNSRGIHLESGLVPSTIKMPTNLAVCPMCIEDDIETYGEPYWHRVHHLPGVTSCPKHQVELYRRCPTCGIPFMGSSVQELPFPATMCPRGHSLLNPNVVACADVNRIAIDSEFILKNTSPWNSPEELRERYVNILYAMGLATPSGTIRQRELYKRFVSHFPIELWTKPDIEKPVPDREWDWLRELVRKPRKVLHPLFHIMLMEFLSGDAIHFSEQRQFQPFGYGPWPCLNKAAPHYMERVVRDLVITICSNTRRPVGTFRCECGFVYSRRGPDQTRADQARYGRIKEFGDVWEDRLRSLVSEDRLSLRGLARELGTDAKVIAAKLQRQNSEETNANKVNWSEREVRRRRFTETMKTNPNLSRSQLRRLNYRDYAWLYRYDRDWIIGVLPLPVSNGVGNKRRIDWYKRDSQLAALVKQVAQSILDSEERPRRVTVGLIGRLCGKRGLLEKHLDKLPLTGRVVDKYCETVVDFQKRRIDWAIDSLTFQGIDVTQWKVMRTAGLSQSISQAVRMYLGQKTQPTNPSTRAVQTCWKKVSHDVDENP